MNQDVFRTLELTFLRLLKLGMKKKITRFDHNFILLSSVAGLRQLQSLKEKHHV